MKKSSKANIRAASSLNKPRGPIARKVITKAKQQLEQKVTNLSEWKKVKINAKNFQETVIKAENLAEYDPAHALYIYAQNQLSILAEQLIELPMLDKLADAYATEMDEYTPSSPPMSPITKSYFTCWGTFDLASTGVKKETLATIAIDFCKYIQVDPELVRLYENMQASRMGIYKHEGQEGDFVLLTELVTNIKVKVIVPSGYLGCRGQIWYVRILPPPFVDGSYDYSIVFTTPYLLGKNGINNKFIDDVENDWLAYFNRNLPKTATAEKIAAYEHLMTYGFHRNYWLEYVFLAYRNYQDDMIYLEGFPDIRTSLPHGDLAVQVR
jgi:hypothetical protein